MAGGCDGLRKAWVSGSSTAMFQCSHLQIAVLNIPELAQSGKLLSVLFQRYGSVTDG